jgi:FdhD protein
MMQTKRPLARLAFQAGTFQRGARMLPEETAVALSYNGTTQAVMMATPAALEDFARGFTLTEGIAAPDEIDSITVVETDLGIDLQIWLRPEAEGRLAARRRTFAAVSALPAQQPLHDATRAVHAAAFWTPAVGMVTSREDVGRHNALDKLAGATAGLALSAGAVVLTSRVSIDMVQKCAVMGAPVLIAVSAPTAHAVDMAEAAGITLIALARTDRFEVFTHPNRLISEESTHVA